MLLSEDVLDLGTVRCPLTLNVDRAASTPGHLTGTLLIWVRFQICLGGFLWRL